MKNGVTLIGEERERQTARLGFSAEPRQPKLKPAVPARAPRNKPNPPPVVRPAANPTKTHELRR